MKKLLCALALSLGFQANAMDVAQVAELIQKSTAETLAQATSLNWKVGDQTDYKLKIAIITGTMVMKVREIGAEGIWMDQDVDLGAFGRQEADLLIDADTGEVKKIIVNGQEQQVPENNSEIVEIRDDNITVPAGTFDCLYAKLRDTQTQEISEAWINPEQVPVSGMLKSIQPSQMGQVVLELTSFVKN